MTTPGNPNRAVLSGMLDDIKGVNIPTPTVEDANKVLSVGNDGKYVLEEKGYNCSGGMTTLTEESVTTQVQTDPTGEVSPYAVNGLSYSELIDADTIYVTFEGKKYTCQKRSVALFGGRYEYGANFDLKTGLPDFSQFPFYIASSVFDGHSQNAFCTETAGTYQIKIESFVESVETTDCFDKAVHETLSKRSGISIQKTLIEVAYPQSTTLAPPSSTSVRPSAYSFVDPNNPDEDITLQNATPLQQYFDFIIPEHIKIIPGKVRLNGFDPNSGEVWLSVDETYQFERGNISVNLYGCNFKVER